MFVAVLLAFVVQTKGDLIYNVVDLGTIPGCTRTRAYSVNNAGQVVGYGYGTGIPAAAILFDSTGGGNATPLAPGEAVSVSYSINDQGDIAGRVGGGVVLWGEHRMDIGAGYDAYSVNESRQVVGANSNGAVLFDISGSGNHTRLGSGEATSINNLEQIVGHQWSGRYQATLFDSTGQGNNVALGGLPGYSDSFTFGINDSGQAVGRVWYGGSPYNGSAVLFDMTGGGNNTDLGYLPGSTDATAAFAINDRGQIVGSALGDAYRPSRAVLFDGSGAGENTDLNSLIDPLLGWELWEARSINDKGWIAGIGCHAGYETAFLLIPVAQPVPVPVPGAVLLGSLGLTYAGCLLRHRRVS
jgi:uncharacterized membrane protein